MKSFKLLHLPFVIVMLLANNAQAQSHGVFEVPEHRGPKNKVVQQNIHNEVWIKIAPSRATLIQFPRDTEVGECQNASNIIVYERANEQKKDGATIFSAISVTAIPKGLSGAQLRSLPETWLICYLRNSVDPNKSQWKQIGFLIDEFETSSIVYLDDIGIKSRDVGRLDMSVFDENSSHKKQKSRSRFLPLENPVPSSSSALASVNSVRERVMQEAKARADNKGIADADAAVKQIFGEQ